MVTFTERPVIGYYVIEDSEKYRWYWMGKSPRVREAVETYFKRHEPGTWNTTPNETQVAIAKEIGITRVALSKNYNELLRKGIIGKSLESDSLQSTGQSGDGSGGGEEEADEACLARRPLGVSPKIHGGKIEDLDPGLRDTLKHTLIPCVQCRTEMDWVDGSHEFGELRLECPECHWATCITNPKLMAVYKHRKQST